MTIGIGIICKGSIILASDSRTEEPDGSFKRTDLSKITTFTCGDFACGIAQAGKTGFSSRCSEEIKRCATESPPKDVQGFRKLVRDVVMQTTRDAISMSPSLDAESRALHARFSLIVAVCGRESHLFSVESSSAYVRPEERGVAFIGTGSSLASYLLGGVTFASYPSSSGMLAAIYAIRGVSSNDSDCEGPIRVWRIFPPPETTREIDSGLVAGLEGDCAKFESESRAEWLNKMARWMVEHGKTIPVISNETAKD